MPYHIDQSGKVEDTHKDTILALADAEFSYAIKITSKTKRALQAYFRSAGEPRLFVYKIFAFGVFALINAYNMKLKSVVVDQEYTGKEKLIGDMLLRLADTFEIGKRITIEFGHIGKSSPAHLRAYLVATRKHIEDKRLGVVEIKKIASCLSPE